MPIRQFDFSKPSQRPPTPSAPLSFRAFIALVNPKYRFYPHVEKLIAVLQRVADDEIKRLMVFWPPRHGKSELVSRLFPAYYLYRHPERFVAISSYAAELAYTFSRAARENYERAGGALAGDAAAVKHWETGEGGGLWAAGVGGPATGKGFHLGITDDPLKNAEEAASATIREKHKEWWRSTWYTREEPGGAMIVVMTRWHSDDLAGWLLSEEYDEEPERWHIVSAEAIKEGEPPEIPPTCTLEPDERAEGEPLAPERYGLAKLKKLAKRLGTYFWNALYQQRPRPREGGFFKRHWFDIVAAAPAAAIRVRYWDRAASEASGDWTVGLLMAAAGGEYWVEDVVRGQWSPGTRDKIIKQTADLDAERYGAGAVRQVGEQEPGASGKSDAQAFVKLLAGHSVSTKASTGAKDVRAGPAASQAEAGNIHLVKGEWNKVYLDEVCDFPTGTNDDQVDGTSGAFSELARGGGSLIR